MVPERQLTTYPSAAVRRRTLAVIVAVTITQYYMLYVKGSVAPQIIDDLDMTLVFYVSITVIGNLLGAAAALASGVADRVGRSRFLIVGSGLVAALTLVAIPSAADRQSFLFWDVLQTALLGAVLSATPALIRDLAPQFTRATAMCTWNLGPILGSLLVSSIAQRTLDDHPDWQFQFYVAGTVGAVAFLLALVGVRELSPALRAQIVTSARDVEDVEQRAAGAAPHLERGAWRQLMVPSIVLPVVGISIFLVFYFTRIAFWVIYFVTTIGFTPAQANGLSTWWWSTSALTLLVAGVVSDRLGVRKPLLLLGASISITALAVFGTRATAEATSYGEFVAIIIPAAFGGVLAFGMWLTAYSEAIEARNPALVATGMAFYGWVVRLTVAAALVLVVSAVSAADTLVDHGPEVGRITTTHGDVLEDLASPDPRVAAAARAQVPQADREYLAEHGPEVARAVADGPAQWERWWRVCLVAQVVALPLLLMLPGAWRRRRRREA